MIDDNVFDYENNEYVVCAFCGDTHVNDKYCAPQLMKKKTKFAWVCEKISEKIGVLMGMF